MQGVMIALLVCSVTMSMLALLYMAVTPIVSRRYSAKGRYYAWLIIVVGLIIPFRPQFSNAIVQIDIPSGTTLPPISAGNGADFIIPDYVYFLPPIENAVLPPAAISVSWWQIGFAVWIVGLITFLIFHAVRHYRFGKMIKRWGENVTDWRLALLQSLQAEMGISKKINLFQCVSMDSPLLIGVVNPCILLPREELDADELRFILKHELVHFKRKDLYYKCLVLLATAVHWFNPLVYLMARAINAQCELSCDDEVVRGTDADTRQQYSETIIGVIKYHTKLKPALSTNFYGGKKGMKKRISSIMDASTKKAGAFITFMALILTLGTSVVFAATTLSETPQENTPTINAVQSALAVYEMPSRSEVRANSIPYEAAAAIVARHIWEVFGERIDDAIIHVHHLCVESRTTNEIFGVSVFWSVLVGESHEAISRMDTSFIGLLNAATGEIIHVFPTGENARMLFRMPNALAPSDKNVSSVFPTRMSLSLIGLYGLDELISSGAVFKMTSCAETGQRSIATTVEHATVQENYINFLCSETDEIIPVRIVTVDGRPQTVAFFIETTESGTSRMVIPNASHALPPVVIGIH